MRRFGSSFVGGGGAFAIVAPFVPVVSAGRVNIVRAMERIPCVFLFAFVPHTKERTGAGGRERESAKLAAISLVWQRDALRKVRASFKRAGLAS